MFDWFTAGTSLKSLKSSTTFRKAAGDVNDTQKGPFRFLETWNINGQTWAAEAVRPPCLCLRFTFIFFNLCSGFVDVTVGPSRGCNYSADNTWVTAWPRLDWSIRTVQTKSKTTRRERPNVCQREGEDGTQTGLSVCEISVSASSPRPHVASRPDWLAGSVKCPGLNCCNSWPMVKQDEVLTLCHFCVFF